MLANDPGHSSCGETVYVGDKAFASWTIEAIDAQGCPYAIRGADLFEFDNGLIARKDAYRKVAGHPGAPANALSTPLKAQPKVLRFGQIVVRPFTHSDVPQLLALMRGLAAFEGYLEEFKVSAADLITFGLGPAAQFEALVAVDEAAEPAAKPAPRPAPVPLLGMCVLYRIPWTYDMKPKLVMKELYVDEAARGRGIGGALLQAARQRARQLGASALIWTVLKGNQRAEAFYTKYGARPDPLWDNWGLIP